jgi:hypothetical protein
MEDYNRCQDCKYCDICNDFVYCKEHRKKINNDNSKHKEHKAKNTSVTHNKDKKKEDNHQPKTCPLRSNNGVRSSKHKIEKTSKKEVKKLVKPKSMNTSHKNTSAKEKSHIISIENDYEVSADYVRHQQRTYRPAKIVLIRHAERPDDPRNNVHLSDKGISRANALPPLLKDVFGQPNMIFSPKPDAKSARSYETAKPTSLYFHQTLIQPCIQQDYLPFLNELVHDPRI